MFLVFQQYCCPNKYRRQSVDCKQEFVVELGHERSICMACIYYNKYLK
jgi:hypothetical protein